MNTGIPVEAWLEGDERALHTALDLIEEQQNRRPRTRGGRQMSG